MPKQTFFNLQQEKQEKILRSAIGEFISKGYENGNVGDIAKKAGVAKGSMYQYFEDKKELFLYTVQWATDVLVKKYYKLIKPEKSSSIFEFLFSNARDIMIQMREERELVIFIQDVFLGKYKPLTDESMVYVNRMADEQTLAMIRSGKENGSIRKDIDDHILSLYITGVTYKIKESMMNRARNAGEDIIDEEYEVYEKEIESMIELLKHGMGGK